MKKFRSRISAFAAAMLVGAGFASAGLPLSSASPQTSENFNSTWDAAAGEATLVLPEGWRLDRNITAPRRVAPWDDATADIMYAGGVNLASNAKNGTWNFGTDSDRAIGGLTTSVDGGTRGINLITCVSNTDPSKIITSIDCSYNIEKYRKGDNPSGFAVQVYTSFDGTTWTSAGDNFNTFFEPDDATIGADIVPISTTTVADKALRTHVEPGNNLYIAWNISVATGATCNKAPGLAIDDVVLKASFSDSDPDWVDPTQPEINHSGLYLRGEINGWGADPDWEFDKTSETTFVLRDKVISGAFKVADASWSSTSNYGSNGGNIIMDKPYSLVSGTDDNISCGANSYPCSRVLLTIDESGATLTFEPETSTEGLTAVYMVGDFNSWNYMDASGELKLDETTGLFKGRASMTAGSDGLSRWIIYQRRAMAGVWGLAAEASESSEEGSLAAGRSQTAAVAPGTYDVTFDLSNGRYSFTRVAAAAADLTLTPSTVVLTPEAPASIRVLSLNNSLIHYNDQAAVFNNIASAAGKDAQWTKHTLLGKSLATHWEEGDGLAGDGNPGAKMMVRSQPWTHIILQEQSSLPRTNFEQFRKNVATWVEYIRRVCPNPNATIILPVNWAYSGDWDNFASFNDIFLTNTRAVADEFGLLVCPVMCAYNNEYSEAGAAGLAGWFSDDRHPTPLSTYMAACMEYGLITGSDIASISYDSPEITAEQAEAMRTKAARALSEYVQTVDHAAGTVRFSSQVIDDFGMPMEDNVIEFSVSPETATISPEGVFTSTTPGVYTVKATSGKFTREANVTVASHITEMPDMSAVSLSETTSEYTQDFDSMGDEAGAAMPEGWRIDRTDAPRTVGTFAAAAEAPMYAGGVSLPSNAKNGTWNFGPDADDRSVGGITTSVSGGARAINVYARFINEGEKALENFTLSYDIEKYRDGNNSEGFTVRLYTSADGYIWKEAGAEFVTEFPASAATAGSAIVPMEVQAVSSPLGITLGRGCELFLAWSISVTSGTNCAGAPALAIDNVEITCEPQKVPEYKWHIYVEDKTGYPAIGAYAYGTSEIWGAWPGQAPIDKVTKDGVEYKVFGHDSDSGSYNLILNNWNQGSQLPDFAFVGGRDYWLEASDKAVTEKTTSAVSSIAVENIPVEYFNIQGMRVEKPSSGFFIRRCGEKVEKVYIR